MVVTDRAGGDTLRLDARTGGPRSTSRASRTSSAGASIVGVPGAGPAAANGAASSESRDQIRERLRAEKAQLRARLKEIEDQEASLRDAVEPNASPKKGS